MPELLDQMYCSQQIVIPPKYPYILKRYCKAAIKTQPYDLLRWSFEYFKALAENRSPPVKLRLEYPVYSTEGGLTRGCLKVLAKQLEGMDNVPLPALRAAWQGFCLDPCELRRILCLCEVYMRSDAVPFLHFLAVAGGLLTKNLTHTMILLCESLTKEPDGGSAAIPLEMFLIMYNFLAKMDASADVKYLNGFKEGYQEEPVSEGSEEEGTIEENSEEESIEYDYWEDMGDLQRISLTNDIFPKSARLSIRLAMPVLGKVSRSPSMERAGQIERENYMRERKGRATRSDEIDEQLRQMSGITVSSDEKAKKEDEKKTEVVVDDKAKNDVTIVVEDEEGAEIPYSFYGEPEVIEDLEEEVEVPPDDFQGEVKEEQKQELSLKEVIAIYVADTVTARQERIEDLERTFDEINAIVEKFKTTSYDLGMIAGRQMSTTSGEFVVKYVEKDTMDYINEQIAILPDPDLKKKKAKPEEVKMIRDLLVKFIDDNMDVIAPEPVEVEEEELPIPEITIVYAVPGIGPPVAEDIIREFVDYATEACKVQADLFMPRNIRHFLCPPLEQMVEPSYEDFGDKEEVSPSVKIVAD